MYKQILVAVDGSATSRQAFDVALGVAMATGATLHPYYVIETPSMYFGVPGYDPSILRDQMISQGAELAKDLDRMMREQGVEGVSLTGEASPNEDTASLVLNAAKEEGADLIVMGTHGRRGFQRLVLGSVAERVLRQSALPVLLIPAAFPAGVTR